MLDGASVHPRGHVVSRVPILSLLISAAILPSVFGVGALSQPVKAGGPRVELFPPWSKDNLMERGGSTRAPKEGIFHGNALVSVGGRAVALAAAQYNTWNIGYAGMWLKTISLAENHQNAEDADWMNEGKWRTEDVMVNKLVADHRYVLHGPRAIVVKDKIFILSLSSNKRKDVPPEGDAFDMEVKLFIGTIDGGAGDGRVVKWNHPASLSGTFKGPLLEHSWKEYFESGGKGVVVGDTILFPLVASSVSGARTCVIARYKYESASWAFTPVKLDVDDCTEPSLLVWEGELLLIVAHAMKNRIYRSVDGGLRWTDTTKGARHALSNFQYHADDDDRGDLVSVKVDGSDVILFTYRAFFNSQNTGGRSLLLWVTDSKRTHCLGPVSSGHLAVLSFSALLPTGSGLYSLHQEGFGPSRSLFFTDLTDHMHQLVAVIGVWKQVDKSVTTLYGSTGGVVPKFDPTVGLVGFWSGAANRTHWQDGYLGMDGTLYGPVKRVTTGFTLGARAANIVFPVSGKDENKVYHLIDNGMSMVVSVAVHTAPKSRAPLLGVGVRNKSRAVEDVGVWYDDKTWMQVSGTTVGAQTLTLEEGKTYQVVFTVRGGVAHTYIDGRPVGDASGSIVPLSEYAEIHEIYVGARERVVGTDAVTDELNVTVFNMLLYSHELSATDVEALLAVKDRSTFEATSEDDEDKEAGQQREAGGASLLWIALVVIPASLIVLGLVGLFVLRRRRAGQSAEMPSGEGPTEGIAVGYNPYSLDVADDMLDVKK